MHSDNTSLVNKLILLVLTLILVCLVLIVIRAYTDRQMARREAAAATDSGATANEPAAGSIEMSPPPPLRRPATNQVRSASRVPTAPQANGNRPFGQPPFDSPNSGTVAFQGIAGFGVVPGAEADSAAALAQGTNGAEIFGVATLLGMPKPELPIDLGPSCGRLNRKRVTTRHYVVNSSGQLANVFVYISQGLNGRFAATSNPVLLDQVGCMFEPYVFGLQTGQTLQVRNSDPEFHNMHFTPRVNPEYNFSQAGKGQVNSFTFKQLELFIRIKCDVHPWMFAYGCVVDHPFFSVTDTNGAFRLPFGMRAGRYTLTATHLKAGALAQEFEYRPGEPRAFTFQFVVPDTTQVRNQ